MALQIHSPSSLKPYNLLQFHYPTKTHFTIRAQNSSEPSNPAVKVSETTVPPKKTSSPGPGLGFGSSSSSSSSTKQNVKSVTDKKKGKRKRERASIIRRSPVEKPSFASSSGEDEAKAKERSKNESAFLLAWLGLGGIILLQGIALAASGFLPEEWDKFFVKYLYPSFTPTVVLFVAGTVVYGVLKYLQNDELNAKK